MLVIQHTRVVKMLHDSALYKFTTDMDFDGAPIDG